MSSSSFTPILIESQFHHGVAVCHDVIVEWLVRTGRRRVAFAIILK